MMKHWVGTELVLGPSSERSFVFSISSVEQSIFITKSILEILGLLFTGRGCNLVDQ